jgi:hypothetical protein
LGETAQELEGLFQKLYEKLTNFAGMCLKNTMKGHLKIKSTPGLLIAFSCDIVIPIPDRNIHYRGLTSGAESNLLHS